MDRTMSIIMVVIVALGIAAISAVVYDATHEGPKQEQQLREHVEQFIARFFPGRTIVAQECEPYHGGRSCSVSLSTREVLTLHCDRFDTKYGCSVSMYVPARSE